MATQWFPVLKLAIVGEAPHSCCPVTARGQNVSAWAERNAVDRVAIARHQQPLDPSHRVPERDRAAAPRGRQRPPVRTEGNGVDAARRVDERWTKFPVTGHVDQHDFVRGPDGERVPIRAERDAPHFGAPGNAKNPVGVCRRVPEEDRPVGSAGGECMAVPAEGDAGDGAAVVPEHSLLGATKDVPENDLVKAARRQNVTVCSERRAVQRSVGSEWTAQRIVGATGGTPEANRPVAAGRGQQSGRRAERHALHGAGMPVQNTRGSGSSPPPPLRSRRRCGRRPPAAGWRRRPDPAAAKRPAGSGAASWLGR